MFFGGHYRLFTFLQIIRRLFVLGFVAVGSEGCAGVGVVELGGAGEAVAVAGCLELSVGGVVLEGGGGFGAEVGGGAAYLSLGVAVDDGCHAVVVWDGEGEVAADGVELRGCGVVGIEGDGEGLAVGVLSVGALPCGDDGEAVAFADFRIVGGDGLGESGYGADVVGAAEGDAGDVGVAGGVVPEGYGWEGAAG